MVFAQMNIKTPDLRDIQARKTIVVNQSLASTNNFIVTLPTLHFQPKYVTIKSILYSNLLGTDSGTYLIWSSLTNEYIGAFYHGIQGISNCPETTIPITTDIHNINFRIDKGDASFALTGLFTMVLEFW